MNETYGSVYCYCCGFPIGIIGNLYGGSWIYPDKNIAVCGIVCKGRLETDNPELLQVEK